MRRAGLPCSRRRAGDDGRRPGREARTAGILALALLAAGCPVAGPREAPTQLDVFAAGSLVDAAGGLKEAFEAEHPGVRVRLNVAGSQLLRVQIEQGAPADVLMSANRAHMDALERQGRLTEATLFACNVPVLITSTGPEAISTFEALPDARALVLGTGDVPIGRYADRVLEKAAARYGEEWRAKVDARIASREINVRQVLAKVVLGEADAAIVYRTDATAAQGAVRTIALPAGLEVRSEYPIAALQGAAHPRVAAQWVAFVGSERGRRILHGFGFQDCE